MTTAQLAGRLGVSQPTVVAFERSEERGSIQLSTLRRVAEALDCHVVYALVPRTSLESTIRQRAQRWLRARRDTVEHTMRLEAQEVTAPLTEADVDDVLRNVSPRRLWD
jgi:predicted DNA-binding mobile mystery protein A